MCESLVHFRGWISQKWTNTRFQPTLEIWRALLRMFSLKRAISMGTFCGVIELQLESSTTEVLGKIVFLTTVPSPSSNKWCCSMDFQRLLEQNLKIPGFWKNWFLCGGRNICKRKGWINWSSGRCSLMYNIFTWNCLNFLIALVLSTRSLSSSITCEHKWQIRYTITWKNIFVRRGFWYGKKKRFYRKESKVSHVTKWCVRKQ